MPAIIEIYQKYLDLKKVDDNEWKTICPFHQDAKPSFYINGEGLYYCFGCGTSGNIYTFLDSIGHQEEKQSLVNFEISKSTLDVNILEAINPIVISQLHRNLMSDLKVLSYLLRERRFSLFIIKKFLIGYDTESDRIAIPIRSKTGKFLNIKLHNSFKSPKAIYWKKGIGERLFPFSALMKNDIVLCEGEFDALLLHSMGINAITSTSGCRSWDNNWLHFFLGKTIKIVYDNDPPGLESSEKIYNSLKKYADVERIILPPFNGKDISDYVLDGNDIYKLLKINKRR